MSLENHPDGLTPEAAYISDWIFREVFGINEFAILLKDNQFCIQFPSSEQRLLMPNIFSALAKKNWLSDECLPSLPLHEVCLSSLPEAKEVVGYATVPVLYGREEADHSFFQIKERQANLSIDIFGSLFFLISRYEEAVSDVRDEHDRFPSWASVMGRAGLLHRPIGNEYIEILWAAMKRIWPGLERKKREFRILPSHDIDHPSAYWGLSRFSVLRKVLGHIRRAHVRSAHHYLRNWIPYKKGEWQNDPFDTINQIMDLSEAEGLKSAFYYIPEKTDASRDLGMPLAHPQIEDQWKRIARRGHEIGVHPGYNTYDDPERILSAANSVRLQLEKLGIVQSQLGGRQHYLRWKTPNSAIAWNSAKLDYDSTLAFADRGGFRCGVCYEFPMYDLAKRRPLKLQQRPLVVMDCTFIDDRYMGLGTGEPALSAIIQLKKECRKYNGSFTVLWHNQLFANEETALMYRMVLENMR